MTSSTVSDAERRPARDEASRAARVRPRGAAPPRATARRLGEQRERDRGGGSDSRRAAITARGARTRTQRRGRLPLCPSGLAQASQARETRTRQRRRRPRSTVASTGPASADRRCGPYPSTRRFRDQVFLPGPRTACRRDRTGPERWRESRQMLQGAQRAARRGARRGARRRGRVRQRAPRVPTQRRRTDAFRGSGRGDRVSHVTWACGQSVCGASISVASKICSYY